MNESTEKQKVRGKGGKLWKMKWKKLKQKNWVNFPKKTDKEQRKLEYRRGAKRSPNVDCHALRWLEW